MPTGQLGHRVVAADRGHRALVAVVERRGRRGRRGGRRSARRRGGRPGSRPGPPAAGRRPSRGRGGDVADGEHLGVAGDATGRRPTTIAAARVRAAQPSDRGERVGRHAGRPHHRAGGDPAPSVERGRRRRRPCRRRRRARTSTPRAAQRAQRPVDGSRRERAEQAVGRLDQHDAGSAHVEVREVLARAPCRTARPAPPASSTPVGPPPHDRRRSSTPSSIERRVGRRPASKRRRTWLRRAHGVASVFSGKACSADARDAEVALTPRRRRRRGGRTAIGSPSSTSATRRRRGRRRSPRHAERRRCAGGGRCPRTG